MKKKIIACVAVTVAVALLATAGIHIWNNREKTYEELLNDALSLQMDLTEGKNDISLKDVSDAYSKAAEKHPGNDAEIAEGSYNFKYILSKVDNELFFSSEYGEHDYIKIAKDQQIRFTLSLQAEKKLTGFAASFEHKLGNKEHAFRIAEFDTTTLKSVDGKENFNGYALDIADGLYNPADTAYSFDEERVRMYNSNAEGMFSFDYDTVNDSMIFECMSLGNELDYTTDKKLFEVQLIANEDITCSVNSLVENILCWDYKSINYSDGDTNFGLIKGTVSIEF